VAERSFIEVWEKVWNESKIKGNCEIFLRNFVFSRRKRVLSLDISHIFLASG
jgi:hypothetical protein